MGIVSPSFILGIIFLFYLSSFVLFAIVRIATGISIQRVGYFSLRHITYNPRDGIRIDLRGLGLHLHRPTFARPTWISLRLTELKITVDLNKLTGAKERENIHANGAAKHYVHERRAPVSSPQPQFLRRENSVLPRNQKWKRLTELKEKIKQLHEKIDWIRMADVEVLNSSLDIREVGSVQIGTLTMAVDTRRKTVDRGRLFRHKKVPAGEQRPAEWMLVVKGVLFTPEGKDSLEIIDICSLNIHGLIYKDLAGLRDASISLKLGRIHIPYDDMIAFQSRIERCLQNRNIGETGHNERYISYQDVMEEWDQPGSREEQIVQTVSDSKEFASSILRGIQEIQLAVSFIGMSKEVHALRPLGKPLYLNFAMNEFGIDLFRLDPKSPAHRMYFLSKDIAHQALLAAISIGVSVDDGGGKPERLLYIPMATTTIKTTLPSKTVTHAENRDVAERNANKLFANLVVTSPSVDLDLKHMPIVLALLKQRTTLEKPSPGDGGSHRLISRLLPKASIKFSIQEPVVRVVLPPTDPSLKSVDEYDLLISSISSISLDLESSHSSAGDLHYALISDLRISSHHFYYQTASGDRHNLLLTDALELKVEVTATPEVYVVISGNLKKFSVHIVRPEISNGVHQIIRQIHDSMAPGTIVLKPSTTQPSILRQLPRWLTQMTLQGSDFGVELAGVDADVSNDTRGIALQLESWNAEYKIQRDAPSKRQQRTSRGTSNSASGDEKFLKTTPPSSTNARLPLTTDNRRLAIHVQGFEGFIVEGIDVWEHEPFISIPRFEVALSTSSDSRGLVFHINSHVKALYLQYSLYRSYAIGVAEVVLRKAFLRANPRNESGEYRPGDTNVREQTTVISSDYMAEAEATALDLKVELVQVKATMPADPPMMLQLYGLEAGRHRYAVPFFKSRLMRLYARAPKVKTAWARIVSSKHLRVDLRESRRKVGKQYVDEKSIDVSADFIRLAVPHQLIIHEVFDNFANLVKATEQLHHRFKTGTNDYVLQKFPEEPKKVPRISIRSKALMFELEDGLFDWKLGIIYRVGLNEQKQRLAREEAYIMKLKRLEEQTQRRDSSRLRSQSTHPSHRGRSKRSELSVTRERSRSYDARLRRRSSSLPTKGSLRMRYDPDAPSGLTDAAKISSQQALLKLQQHNSESWKQRINAAMQDQRNVMRELETIFWGNDELPDNMQDPETIVAMPNRPGLLSTLISDLHIVIDKPSFPTKDYAKYLHAIGKGMPYDMEYSLLIPMNLQINMGEARMTLRDYPLPLLHVPAIKTGQSPRLPSWSLKTDFVIAEEFRDSASTKHVKVEIIPAHKITSPAEVNNGFWVNVCRTISPVKTYSNVDVSINTSNPTSITWGTSYQPAIQDMMQIIENFTKPQIDPSDRTGFWDKIRLICHSRVSVAWKGDGDVHLKLKGSRDPYTVTGHGAGFVMCFRNRVRWNIHQDDDPRKFMTVSSGEYVLAIPDYSQQAREASQSMGHDSDNTSSYGSQINNAIFKKVVMKLSGNVRWNAGLVFERNLDKSGRSFDFIPHYAVSLKTPQHVNAMNTRVYDAFRGFRSHHIHLSIAVIAPSDRDWSMSNLKPSSSYNSVHMSPRFFTHFFDWWSLFSGVMSLPIRQGKLFPGVEKSSKKFGRHLATIKYNLLLSPLFISHIYKHKDVEDYSEEMVGATGLKLRIDSFMLDLHQRREEFVTQSKGRIKQSKTSGMRINQAQLDFVSADFRAVSASIAGTSSEDLKRATDEDLAGLESQATSPDISRFTIPDNDLLWIDMDDFVELDWILPAETHPETKIMPLAFAPRFTYFRQTDHHDGQSGDPGGSSKFGDEPTHYCIMSQDNDPQRVQLELIKRRVSAIEEQLKTHHRTLGEQELRVVRDSTNDPTLKEQLDQLKEQGLVLEEKKVFLESMVDRLSRNLKEKQNWDRPSHADRERDAESSRSFSSSSPDISETPDLGQTPDIGKEDVETEAQAEFSSEFNNRFTVHNIQLKWNNALRNIILRYVHQVSQRRGFVYYMSRRAVKFILDIVEEQRRHKEMKQRQSEIPSPTSRPSPRPSPNMSFHTRPEENDINLEERIQEILRDGRNFVNANDPTPSEISPGHYTENLRANISEEFTPLNSYNVRLIAPQIQLQSEKNAKSVLLVTAKGMQLKVIQIMDKARMADDVSGLVQRRFSVEMDGVQFFVTSQKTLARFLHLYSANRYGSPRGSAWPPWVPIEVNFDFTLNPFGWSRVVKKTSASLRYDKYNTLRLKYNDEVSKGEEGQSHALEDSESRIDHIWVEFPQVHAICDSAQYYTMYVIVLDLLLYNEPLEKIRSERLEKIMLAADFSDLTGAPEMIISLQERIQQLEEIKRHFQIHAKDLDRQGWQDRLSIERDLTNCEDELFFMMKAITTSQRKIDDRSQSSQSNGLLRWYLSASELVWHLMREKDDPLLEIQLKNAAYDRTDNSDGSNYNIMEIERIRGLNLLNDALYPEMIMPYFEKNKSFADYRGQGIKMFKVQWYMLEAIAGIPVLDQFEVNLFPLKVELEREIGKQLFDYIFPGNSDTGGSSPFMVKHKQPTAEDEDDSDGDLSMPTTPISSLAPESAETQTSTRAGSLELRLRPTLKLSDLNERPTTSLPHAAKSSVVGMNGESHRFNLFPNSNRSKSATRSQASMRPPPLSTVSRRRSGESLSSSSLARSNTDTSSSTTNLAGMNSSTEKPRRFVIHRTNSKDVAQKEKSSDDLSEMMSRASNYMTLAYVKIPSVVLCLSYKGRGERNLEDVHNFVFRMPALEYRNKTWSNLDLALRLKKDIIKALISHTGAIIGNKFTQHRPSKYQQSRLREIANSSSLLPNTDNLTNTLTRSATAVRNLSRSHVHTGNSSTPHIPAWQTSTSQAESEVSSMDSMSAPLKHSGSSIASTETQPIPTNDALDFGQPQVHGLGINDESVREPAQNRFLNNSFARRITNEFRHRDGSSSGKEANAVPKDNAGSEHEERQASSIL